MNIAKKDKIALLIMAILGVLIFLGIIGNGVGDDHWCGLTVDNLTDENISYYHLNTINDGVVVTEVKGRAQRSGVQRGDVITGINGTPVNDMHSFLKATRTADNGSGIVVRIKRNGQPMRFPLTGPDVVSTGYSKPADLVPVPTDPLFLTGGTNPPVYSNMRDNRVQPQRIPSEGIWLGMEIEQITSGTIRELNLPANQTGIIVDSAPIGSVAEKAGLRNGDVVTAINEQRVVNMADYIRATNNQKTTSANLEVLRNGKRLYLTVPSDKNREAGAPDFVQSVPGKLNTSPVPPISLDSVMPHGYRGVCSKCHQIIENMSSASIPLNSQTGNFGQRSPGLLTPAQQNAAHKVLVEGHWLGMELIPIIPELAREYNLPYGINGLLVDEVTLEAAESGLLAGDVLQSINSYPIKTLEDFALATKSVEPLKEANLGVLRNGKPEIIRLRSSWDKLGIAQNEAAQPIQPGALSPHRDRGRPCTDCHIIMKNGGQLAIDSGDIVPDPPPISKNMSAPHPYRGVCNACHVIYKQ